MTWSRPSRRELTVLTLALLAAVALRIAYVLITDQHDLPGDQYEYDVEARFAADGRFLWSTVVYGQAHASAWKAPGYPAWLGAVYWLFGPRPQVAFVLQALLFSTTTIVLAWALARRLFTPAVGIATAIACALYPNVWQFDVRLYSEGLATPLGLGLALVVLPAAGMTWRRAALAGVLLGLSLLVRPSAIVFVPGLAVMCWTLAGARRGSALLALGGVVAALVVAPWTLRNHALFDNYRIPISVQGAVGYGTFNDEAAHDPDHPWLWRPAPPSAKAIFATPRPEDELYADLNRLASDYVRAHPESIPKAFYWNGIRRLWDLRPPGEALFEVPFEGRTRLVTAAGLALYWPLLALAVAACVRLWRGGRRGIVLALLATALAASIAYTPVSGTRYRAPFEPVIVILAMSSLPALRRTPSPHRPRA